MDDKTSFLFAFIIGGIIILVGLSVVIFGIVKRRKLFIALGVFIALIPNIISYLTK